jgi:UDP-glucuronate 4-epimerase
MNILITGCAGFIGFNLSNKLLKNNANKIIGVDNINSYYDKKLKIARMKILNKNSNFSFEKCSLENFKDLKKKIKKYKIDIVVNLAAQAGVRYSLEKPESYTRSNLVGFANILEICREKKSNLIFASTSSVYGDTNDFPIKEGFNTNKPIQYYAATKKSNEVMAYSYSQLFDIKTIGLRFFTVYGPWGRPDMALFKFTKNIILNKEIEVFNKGKHFRDFTYIDDIVSGIIKSIKHIKKNKDNKNYFDIFNLGRGKSVSLKQFIDCIEKVLKKKAKKKYLPKQKGDIYKTHCDIKKSKKILGYNPTTNFRIGVKNFINWYRKYYSL